MWLKNRMRNHEEAALSFIIQKNNDENIKTLFEASIDSAICGPVDGLDLHPDRRTAWIDNGDIPPWLCLPVSQVSLRASLQYFPENKMLTGTARECLLA